MAYSFDKQRGLTRINKSEEYGIWWSCSFNAIDRQQSCAADHLLGLDWIGLDWIGLDWIGLDWIGLDWIGLTRNQAVALVITVLRWNPC